MDLVSVIIPCYNQGKYIEECINSVKNQDYENIEIIIVNDGSTEQETKDILNDLKNDKSLKIFNIKNSGVAYARNYGIKKSNGKYILPLDADDKIGDTYIRKCISVLKEDKADIVYCLSRNFDANNKLVCLKEFSVKIMLQTNVVFCSAVFRRKDYDKTIGYNSNMIYGLEDWDFWLSMIEQDLRFYRINEVLFYYRIKEKSRNYNVNKDTNLYNKAVEQLKNNHKKLFKEYEEVLEKETHISHIIIRKINTVLEMIKSNFFAYISSKK